MSYAEVTKTYLQSSSIRGFPRIIRAQNVCSKLTWAVVVLGFTGVAIWQVYLVVLGYLHYEVQLEYRSRPEPAAPFPSVTVCNQQPFAADPETYAGSRGYYDFVSKLNRLQSSLNGSDLRLLRNTAAFYQNSRVTQVDAIAHIRGSFVKDCVFELVDGNHVVTQRCGEDNLQKFPHPRYFRCHTIKCNLTNSPGAHLRSLRIIMYLDNFNYPFFGKEQLENDMDAVRQGVRVSVHPSGSLPQLDDNYIDVPPGTSATLQVSTVRRLRMAKPYGSCRQERPGRIRATSPLEDSLSYAYTQHACHRICLQQELIRECGCIDPRLPVPEGFGIDDDSSDIDKEPMVARMRRNAEFMLEEEILSNGSAVIHKEALSDEAAKENLTVTDPTVAAHISPGGNVTETMAFVKLVPYCRKWPKNFDHAEDALKELQKRISCSDKLRDTAANQKSCLVNRRNLTCHLPCQLVEHSVDVSYAGWPQESFHLAIYDKYISAFTSKKYFTEYDRIEKMIEAKNFTAAYKALAATKLMKDNFVEIMVLKPSWNVTTIAEVPSFPFFRLMSAIGGTMNLWSGITIIAIFEFLELLAILAATFCRKNCPPLGFAAAPAKPEPSEDEVKKAFDSGEKPVDNYGSLFAWTGK